MTYGPNFGFRVFPHGGQRHGDFITPATGDKIPLGAPVKASGALDSLTGLQPVALATGAQAPVKGRSGILVYEYTAYDGYRGLDPVSTTFSDLSMAPLGEPCQVVHGDAVMVWFKNTAEEEFLHTKTYPGRIMVAGAGATPTLQAGDMLTPGTGNDTAGYWAETNSAANAWLIVRRVDTTLGLIEAELAF